MYNYWVIGVDDCKYPLDKLVNVQNLVQMFLALLADSQNAQAWEVGAEKPNQKLHENLMKHF